MSAYERAKQRLTEYDSRDAYGPFKYDEDRDMWMASYLGALSECLRQVLDEIGPDSDD